MGAWYETSGIATGSSGAPGQKFKHGYIIYVANQMPNENLLANPYKKGFPKTLNYVFR